MQAGLVLISGRWIWIWVCKKLRIIQGWRSCTYEELPMHQLIFLCPSLCMDRHGRCCSVGYLRLRRFLVPAIPRCFNLVVNFICVMFDVWV
ncbi:hypothetical protein BRADI_5g18413v3 [Brachypodium distachyon]|uniref:Uncharacterized protein n=1 Tax=Brachypodium distachyon TaxID=15368 RepID=A0A0Q3H793_BRADI|nr:hypothetical protein BRADI_5g18413v3 [Brachypodium distachyon]